MESIATIECVKPVSCICGRVRKGVSLFLSGIMLTICITVQVNAADGNSVDLQLTIHCAEKVLKQGDEIPIVFTITNRSSIGYRYTIRNYDRTGRMYEYALTATDEDGKAIPDPRQAYELDSLGGLSSGEGEIKEGQSFEKTISLNHWALINKPGCYTVTGTYYSETVDADNRQIIVKSSPIDIVVEPRSEEEMSQYIEALAEKIKTIKAFENIDWQKKQKQIAEREVILKKLVFTCDPKIIPVLIDVMYENHSENDRSWVMEAFAFYLKDKNGIKNAVLERSKSGLAPGIIDSLMFLDCEKEFLVPLIPMALDSNDADIVAEGADAASTYPNDSYTPRLIELAFSDNIAAQMAAIPALANNRTDEGVMALKEILKGPKKFIREITCESIMRAYESTPGRPLRGDDFKNELEENCLKK